VLTGGRISGGHELQSGTQQQRERCNLVSAKVGCPVALELALKPGDAEKRSGAEESVLASHAPYAAMHGFELH